MDVSLATIHPIYYPIAIHPIYYYQALRASSKAYQGNPNSQTCHEAHQPMSGLPVTLPAAPELGLWLQEWCLGQVGWCRQSPRAPFIWSLGPSLDKDRLKDSRWSLQLWEPQAENPRNDLILSEPQSPVQARSRSWELARG